MMAHHHHPRHPRHPHSVHRDKHFAQSGRREQLAQQVFASIPLQAAKWTSDPKAGIFLIMWCHVICTPFFSFFSFSPCEATACFFLAGDDGHHRFSFSLSSTERREEFTGVEREREREREVTSRNWLAIDQMTVHSSLFLHLGPTDSHTQYVSERERKRKKVEIKQATCMSERDFNQSNLTERRKGGRKNSKK